MLLRVGVVVLSLWIGFFILAGVVIHQTGLLIVDVQDKVKGNRVLLPVPMLMVNFGLSFLPDHRFEMIRSELEQHQELLRAVGDQLAGCPDATFLKVETRKENVSIAKRGKNLLIDVDSSKDRVHIQVPIRATGKAITRIVHASM